MKEKIRVIIKEPGKDFRQDTMPNTLEAFQKLVGGYIEAIPVTNRMIIICNEEGKLLDLPQNFELFGSDIICGTAIFCGVDGEDFGDVPLALPVVKGMFPNVYSVCHAADYTEDK